MVIDARNTFSARFIGSNSSEDWLYSHHTKRPSSLYFWPKYSGSLLFSTARDQPFFLIYNSAVL